MCGFHHKNQSGLELKIVLPIENGEEPLLVLYKRIRGEIEAEDRISVDLYIILI
jgi:hypothetical protein